jgi:hypothetical protein
MPLIRLKDEYLEQEDGVRFLMADELGNTVACKVSHEALRAHADRVHLSGSDSAVFQAAHPHWDFSASNGGVPPKHETQQVHDGYNCKNNNCRDREWLIHSLHRSSGAREKGWAGI